MQYKPHSQPRHQATSSRQQQPVTRFHRISRQIGCFVAAVCLVLAASSNALAEKINLNTADAEALEYIPGIGPAKAREIIALRSAGDGFKSIDDLLEVPGIGAKTLEVIRQHGSVDSGVATLTDQMRQNPARRNALPESSSSSIGTAGSG